MMRTPTSNATTLTQVIVLTAVAAAAAACGGGGSGGATSGTGSTAPAPATGGTAASPRPLPQGSEPIRLDPAAFSATIDNPYWPMRPGSRWVYREGAARDVVTVQNGTKMIAGIQARIIRDQLIENGKVTEDTFDWYAQDRDGNVWYMGEDTKEFVPGKPPNTKGSWQAGVNGAQAGVIVPARPTVGLTYRQEYFKGQAEDTGQVLAVGTQARVPFGTFGNTLKTKDYSPLEPNVVEQKYYAPGVGPVLAVTVSGGSDREELVAYTKGP
jgi:hypothetical protein